MNKKEEYLFRDRSLRMITEEGDFKAVVVKATELVENARKKHELNPLASKILGELLVGALLMASTLKNEERISIRFEVDGDMKYAVAEANAAGEVRGYLGNPDLTPASDDPVEMGRAAIGLGQLHVTKNLYANSRPVTSTTEVVHSSIVKDLTRYYAASEQTPTAIQINIRFNDDFSIKHAMGLFIQTLPDVNEQAILDVEMQMIDHPNLGEFLNNKEYLDDILKQIFKGRHLKEISRTPVDFFCRCSKKRFLETMRLLHLDDLTDLATEPQELVCHYCNTTYTIDQAEVEAVLKEKQALK